MDVSSQPYSHLVAKSIAARMKARNVSVAELHRRLQRDLLSEWTVRSWFRPVESDGWRSIDLDYLPLIAEALGLTVKGLLP